MSSVIPVYPTSASLMGHGMGGVGWREWFPFSAGTGSWTFSGRVALYHGLPSLNIPPGSTILVPTYHQGVEIETLLSAGYRLRYYRLTEDLRIDLGDVERRIDQTVSVLYVIHYFGFPQPLDSVRQFCEAHRLRLIEDCALSLFSRDNGAWLGSVGDLALFSVYKTLALPHGGFLVTKNAGPPVKLRSAPVRSTLLQTLDLAHHGLRARGWGGVERSLTRSSRWIARRLGWARGQMVASGDSEWDPRLLEFGASPWSVWLMRFIDRDKVIATRRANFLRLASLLEGHLPVPFRQLPPGACPLFLPVFVPDKTRFQNDLKRLGVQSVNLWDASHRTCPPELAEEVSGWRRHCLELPIHQELSTQEVDRVAESVLRVLADH